MNNATSPFDVYMLGGGLEAAAKRGVAKAVEATRIAVLVPATKKGFPEAAKIPVELVNRVRRWPRGNCSTEQGF